MSKHALMIPPLKAGRTIRSLMVGVAIVTVFVAATLALPHRPAPVAAASPTPPEPLHQSSDISPAVRPVAPSASNAVRAAAAPVVAPGAVTESRDRTPVSKLKKNRIAEAATPAAAVTAIEDPATTWASSESTSAEPARVSVEPVEPGTVTITGCLEASVNEDRFRLTDTDGVDAPKSRSWRTGFLKKRSTAVALVEPPDPHALRAQIGHRVAATGVLTSRELRTTSLRVISPQCN